MDEEVAECPYCQTIDDNCEHLMLVVDLTFINVLGGHLYKLAKSRLSHMLEEAGEDCDEQEVLDEFLEEVSSCGGYEVYHEFEGVPGNSTNDVNFYSDDPAAMAAAYLRLTN